MPHPLDEKRAGACPGQAAHGGRGDVEDDLRPGDEGRSRGSMGHRRRRGSREKNEKLGALMDASRDDVLAYMSFPREHWAQIASTNPLERVNREIKRRADVIGIFPNDEAIIRLVGTSAIAWQGRWLGLALGRSRPCVRRRRCSTWAARPDEVRQRSGPNQWHALEGASVRTGGPECRVAVRCHHLTLRLTISMPGKPGCFVQAVLAR